MTREEIIDGLEIYTVGRSNKATVHITVEELQKFIDAIKSLEQEPVLDKIRVEIAELQLIGYATVDGKREIASRAVMQIIDKYRSEGSGEE